MTFGRNRPYRAENMSPRNHRKEAQPDQGGRDEPACHKIGIRRRDDFIKPLDILMQLSAHSTDQEITIPRHFP